MTTPEAIVLSTVVVCAFAFAAFVWYQVFKDR